MASNGSPKNGDLSRSQRRAIPALVTERTIADAASVAGVGERSINRWLADDPGFRAALSRAESVAIDNATRRLCQLSELAVKTLEDVMRDEDASVSVQVRAADLALSHMARLRELSDVERRLAELEGVVYGKER